MSGSLNRVMLIGNGGRDPEMRSTQDGRRIASFSVATSERWNDRVSGEKKERTSWHNIVVFNEHLAEVVEKYVKKGSKLYVEGQLQTRKWTDQQGHDRYTTEGVLSQYRGEITLLGDSPSNRPPPAGSADQYGRESRVGGYGSSQDTPGSVGAGGRDLNDDIPF